MINAIHRHEYTLPTPAAAAPPPSTGFGDTLGNQLQLPDPRTLFGYTPPGAAPSTKLPAVVTGAPTTPAAQPTGPTDTPTPQSVFGDQPWIQDPQGAGPLNSSWHYNPIYFTTQATAAKVAAMVGGTVIEQKIMTPTPGSPLQQTDLNEMVQLKDGSVINPGLIADFYSHGYSQSYVDQMIQNEIQGV